MPFADSTNSRKRSHSPHSITAGPAHKKQCLDDRKARCRQEESPTKLQTSVCELDKLLRRLAKSVDSVTLRALKDVASGSGQVPCMTAMVQSIIERVKNDVAERSQSLKGKQKMLQAELYLEWLREYDFVLVAVENVLRAKVKIATGKTLFSVLFYLIDEYISAVDAHQDGWSHRSKMPVEPHSWVMTLVEEANDSSTDERSIVAVQEAEAELERFDTVMAEALKRYKVECTDPFMLSGVIGRKQENLARSCCLLSEQTGYGDADDMGFGLLVTTRESMLRWKSQCGSSVSEYDSGHEI
ncbi:hypothetical protein C8R43DRAFT_1061819 [Mycena crocata]|nr:hypothetical protein C8R43DRAFT_1061819 [Mycena crocata]